MTAIAVRSARPAEDRRTQRTRAALLTAFREMMLTSGYDAITPTTLAAAANVGRSTFYEHFCNVDEVLAFSIAGLLAPLAATLTRARIDPAAAGIVQHFWDQRKMARAMLAGGGHRVVTALFTEQIEAGLASLRAELGSAAPLASPKLAAAHLAAGSLALLAEWLSGRASGSADDIAEALHAAGYAAALAFSRDEAELCKISGGSSMLTLLLALSLAASPAPTGGGMPDCNGQIAVTLDDKDGDFNGMSHSGAMLVIRNLGPDTCSMAGLPRLRFENAKSVPLPVRRRAPVGMRPGPVVAPVVIAAGAQATTPLRWVSSDVYGAKNCATPQKLIVGEGDAAPMLAFRTTALRSRRQDHSVRTAAPERRSKFVQGRLNFKPPAPLRPPNRAGSWRRRSWPASSPFSARSRKSLSIRAGLIRRRRKSAHRNSKKGAWDLAKPPARIRAPTRLLYGSSARSARLLGMSPSARR